MVSTKEEIEECREYLKHPDKVKKDILNQDGFNQQIIKHNIKNGYKNKGFNYPNTFSVEDICCGEKLIPTNYCWDANTKRIIGYPNYLLYSYPIISKDPKFITFLDINPNHDINYHKQIETLYSGLTTNVVKSANMFDFNEEFSSNNLDKIIDNVIIPGFLKTLDNAEEMINSDKMSIPDLFITHNYSLENLYEKIEKQYGINYFLYDLFHSKIFKNDFLNTFLSYNKLFFNWNDLNFIHSLIENNLDKIYGSSIYYTEIAVLDIFRNSFYQETPYVYPIDKTPGCENFLGLIDDWCLDLDMRR